MSAKQRQDFEDANTSMFSTIWDEHSEDYADALEKEDIDKAQRVELSPQHVVVFANHEPDYTLWSEDRYDVREIEPTEVDTDLEPSKKKQRAATDLTAK